CSRTSLGARFSNANGFFGAAGTNHSDQTGFQNAAKNSQLQHNYPLFLRVACTILLGMQPVPPNQQRSLVERLAKMCGGGYSPETRSKYFISRPQWAASYQGQALFYAPTRQPITFEDVIRKFSEIGIGYWCTHDSDVIPTEALGTDRQAEIVGKI